ncbi:MAG: PD-(D/E)XK nuclease family protein [Cyanobacteria bacterium P01_H01_bin.119]
MAYSLSASKLKTYHRCPRAYYFQYEYGLGDGAAFGAAALGQALHRALAQIYSEWHYLDPIPLLNWVANCWQQQSEGLSTAQSTEGWKLLKQYYEQYILPLPALKRPLAVESRIQGKLQVAGVEFKLGGRYDRLDWLDDGLELIDYKSAKDPHRPDSETVDIQMGLYYLALEQRYNTALKRMSLLYLRTGEKLSFEASTAQKARVASLIGDLALQLLADQNWQPKIGSQCDRCTFARHCTAVCADPVPLPDGAKPIQRTIQLALSL